MYLIYLLLRRASCYVYHFFRLSRLVSEIHLQSRRATGKSDRQQIARWYDVAWCMTKHNMPYSNHSRQNYPLISYRSDAIETSNVTLAVRCEVVNQVHLHILINVNAKILFNTTETVKQIHFFEYIAAIRAIACNTLILFASINNINKKIFVWY